MHLDEKYLTKLHSNPFNWTGSKHRYLKELFEVLPNVEHLTVIDPFVGGGDLISKLPATWSIFASDSMPQLIKMHKDMQGGLIDVLNVNHSAGLHGLSNESVTAFESIKSIYNKEPNCDHNALELYLLLCHSNTNRIRFNNKGEFNVAFGKRTFNASLQSKLGNYCNQLNRLTIDFSCKKFQDVDFVKGDVLLIDPPYANTTATYNEGGGWSLNDELALYVKINDAVATGVKFVYFGQTWSKGVHNQVLENWGKQFNIKVLKDTTKHCSSNRNDKSKTVEVLITNL